MRRRDRTVLALHSRYRQRGGEDQVFESEVGLLRENGWNVIAVEGQPLPPGGRHYVKAATNLVWSADWYRRVRVLVRKHRPGIVHVHNTFPLMSPSVFHAARDAGAAVVHTLHNYRLLCSNSYLFRDGGPCEDCVGRRLVWPAIVHACYRGSRLGTAGVAAMTGVHRLLKTWERQVDVHVATTEFARQMLKRSGVLPERVVVKPNFVSPDPGMRQGVGDYALFVGRLSAQKGFGTLLAAWESLQGMPLRIVGGAGPVEAPDVRTGVPNSPALQFLGELSRERTLAVVKGSRFVVVPSLSYETFGLSIAEAFACGVPVIASRLGAMVELVEDGRTGLHVIPGDSHDLAEKMRWAWTHPEEMSLLGRRAREVYEMKYTAERNYEILAQIYDQAQSRRASDGFREGGRPRTRASEAITKRSSVPIGAPDPEAPRPA